MGSLVIVGRRVLLELGDGVLMPPLAVKSSICVS